MAKKATIEKLNGLHDLMANYFTDQLEAGEELSSGTLAAINSFLKTNNVVAETSESEPLQDLQKKLKELMLDDKE